MLAKASVIFDLRRNFLNAFHKYENVDTLTQRAQRLSSLKAVRKLLLSFLKAIFFLPSTVLKLDTSSKMVICAPSIVSGERSAPLEGKHPADSLLG